MEQQQNEEQRSIIELLRERLRRERTESEELQSTVQELSLALRNTPARGLAEADAEALRERIRRLQEQVKSKDDTINDLTTYLLDMDARVARAQDSVTHLQEMKEEAEEKEAIIQDLVTQLARYHDNDLPNAGPALEDMSERLSRARAERNDLMEALQLEQQRSAQTQAENEEVFGQQTNQLLQQIQARDVALLNVAYVNQQIQAQRIQEVTTLQNQLYQVINLGRQMAAQHAQDQQEREHLVRQFQINEERVQQLESIAEMRDADRELLITQGVALDQKWQEQWKMAEAQHNAMMEEAQRRREQLQNLLQQRDVERVQLESTVRQREAQFQTQMQQLQGELNRTREELNNNRALNEQRETELIQRAREHGQKAWDERVKAYEESGVSMIRNAQHQLAQAQETEARLAQTEKDIQTRITELQTREKAFLERTQPSGRTPMAAAKPRPTSTPRELLPSTSDIPPSSTAGQTRASNPELDALLANNDIVPDADAFNQMVAWSPAIVEDEAAAPAAETVPELLPSAQQEEDVQVARLLGTAKAKPRAKAKPAAATGRNAGLPEGVVRPADPVPFTDLDLLRPVNPWPDPENPPTMEQRRLARADLRDANTAVKVRHTTNGPRSWHTASSDDYHTFPVDPMARPLSGVPSRLPGGGLRGRPAQVVEGPPSVFANPMRSRQLPDLGRRSDDDVVQYTIQGVGGRPGRGRLTTRGELNKSIAAWERLNPGNPNHPFVYHEFVGVRWTPALAQRFPNMEMTTQQAKIYQQRWNEKLRTYFKAHERNHQLDKFQERKADDLFLANALDAISETAPEASPVSVAPSLPSRVAPAAPEGPRALGDNVSVGGSSNSLSINSSGGTLAEDFEGGAPAPYTGPGVTRTIRVGTVAEATELLPGLEQAADRRIVRGTDARMPTGQTPPANVLVHASTPSPDTAGGEVAVGGMAADEMDLRVPRSRIFSDIRSALAREGLMNRATAFRQPVQPPVSSQPDQRDDDERGDAPMDADDSEVDPQEFQEWAEYARNAGYPNAPPAPLPPKPPAPVFPTFDLRGRYLESDQWRRVQLSRRRGTQ